MTPKKHRKKQEPTEQDDTKYKVHKDGLQVFIDSQCTWGYRRQLTRLLLTLIACIIIVSVCNGLLEDNNLNPVTERWIKFWSSWTEVTFSGHHRFVLLPVHLPLKILWNSFWRRTTKVVSAPLSKASLAKTLCDTTWWDNTTTTVQTAVSGHSFMFNTSVEVEGLLFEDTDSTKKEGKMNAGETLSLFTVSQCISGSHFHECTLPPNMQIFPIRIWEEPIDKIIPNWHLRLIW